MFTIVCVYVRIVRVVIVMMTEMRLPIRCFICELSTGCLEFW